MLTNPTEADGTRRIDTIALAWLGLSVFWAVVIFVTDVVAWPLALDPHHARTAHVAPESSLS